MNLGEAEKVDGDGGPGTVVEHSYLMAGVAFPVTTRVVDVTTTGTGGKRLQIEFTGQITGWQTWDYEPRGDGATLVTAEIEYNVPGKAIGKFADRLVVERLQERARQQTLENLKLMAES